MDAFTRRNRARIPVLLLLATLNYCFAVVVAAVIGGVTTAVTIVFWAMGEGGWTPSSAGELKLVGVVLAGIAVIGAVGGLLLSVVRFATLRRRLEARVVDEAGALVAGHEDETRVRATSSKGWRSPRGAGTALRAG